MIKAKRDDRLSDCESEWITYIKNIFNTTGYGNIWYEAPIVLSHPHSSMSYVNWLKKSLRLRLNDIFKQEWYNNVQTNGQSSNYRIFKETLHFERYLVTLNDKEKINMCKFRCRSTKLPVITASTYNLEDEHCKLCDLNEIGDEFHYILKCPYFSHIRRKLFKTNKKRINCLLMKEIFNDNCMRNLKTLATLINEVMSHFQTNIVKKCKTTQDLMYTPQPITRSGRSTQRPIILDL